MATKKLKKNVKNSLVAKLIEEDNPEGGSCSFCQRTVNNELLFGKLYLIGDLYCHYFCVLLSCCLVQKGEDDEGLLGFLYTDIVNEIERSKKHRMALSAGMHYIKCPLCNDKETFYRAVVSQGYYLPDRDAAWELERNAFRDIYERQVSCDLPECKCPQGRGHDDTGAWDIKVCLVCGTVGAHVGCLPTCDRFLCDSCMAALAKHTNYTLVIQALTELEQSESKPSAIAPATPPRPLMGPRMSVRRTKPMHVLRQSASCSKKEAAPATIDESTSSAESPDTKKDTVSSRLDLNLKPPRKPTASAAPTVLRFLDTNVLRNLEKKLPESPMKLLIERVNHKLLTHSVESATEISKKLLKTLSQLDYKPKPRSAKQHYLDSLLDEIFNEVNSGQLSSLTSPNKFGSSNKFGSPNGQVSLKFNYQKTPDRTKTGNTQSALSIPKSDVKNKTPKNHNTTEIGNTLTPKDKTPNATALTPKNITPNGLTPNIKTVNDLTPNNKTPNGLNCSRNTKLTTVDIQNDKSMEISAENNSVSIDLVKIESSSTTDIAKSIPTDTPKCTLKFSPMDKEILSKTLNLDLESFKSQYLKEVDTNKCSFNHKHNNDSKKESRFQTVIDFAVEAAVKIQTTTPINKTDKITKKNKRKADTEDDPVANKKKKHSSPKIKLIYRGTDSVISQRHRQSAKRLKKKLKNKKRNRSNNVSIRGDKDLKVKIKWKEESLRLKITKSKKSRKRRKERENVQQVFTQTVLNFSPDNENKDANIIERPEKGVTPLKRKYVRHEKHQDHLKQTTLQNFFKVKIE